MILNQDHPQASFLVEYSCPLPERNQFIFRKEAHQNQYGPSFYQASATAVLPNFLGRRRARVMINISFLAVYSSDAFFYQQKALVNSIKPLLFLKVLNLLDMRGAAQTVSPQEKNDFRICINVHRCADHFGMSYLTFAFGFDDKLETEKRTESFPSRVSCFNNAVLKCVEQMDLSPDGYVLRQGQSLLDFGAVVS